MQQLKNFSLNVSTYSEVGSNPVGISPGIQSRKARKSLLWVGRFTVEEQELAQSWEMTGPRSGGLFYDHVRIVVEG